MNAAVAALPDARSTTRDWPSHAAAAALIVVGAAAHVLYLIFDCPLDLSGDEAHYWEWSRDLDWSYYSKGPLVAYIIAAGRALLSGVSHQLVGSDAFAVRAPAIALSCLTLVGLHQLALRTLGSARAALAVVTLCTTVPLLVAGSMLMTIDAPLACAWVWMLLAVHRALRTDALRAWLAAGVLIAVGILAKYNMLLAFPAIGLLILTRPELRRFALRPGPYAATAVGLLGFVPIAIWNAQNDWVSFRHVAGQAGVSASPRVLPLGPLDFAAGQLAVLGPVWAVLLGVALFTWRRWAAASGVWAGQRWDGAFLFWPTVAPLGVFAGFSLVTKIQPNWPALAVLTATIVIVQWFRVRARSGGAAAGRNLRRLALAGAGLGLAAGLVIHRSEVLMPVFRVLARTAPPWELTPAGRFDPTARLRGWRELGAAVGAVLAEQRAAGRDPFIAADEYQVASLIAFYTPGNPRCYSFQSALGGRLSQYDLWPGPIRDAGDFIGRPVIYVGSAHERLTGARGGPAALPGLRVVRTIEHRVAGERMAVWSIRISDSFAGFAQLPEAERRY